MEAKQTPLIDLRAALAQQAEPTVTEDMKSAVRWAPSSAYWSERLREFFGPDAREGIDALERRLAKAQQAEPVAGKVVAWGVFANIDGEWQLQHPVFAGDEQGKLNAEFERASYSGPQPLEVRPLGVVTATAQQAELVQEQRDELRRALEIIAVGDATNPQAQAAEELIALGYWRDIPEARAAIKAVEEGK